MIKHKLSLQIIKSTYNPSILLSCDNDRYLFNIPEGFQRFYKEHNVKLCQGCRIFFTQIKPGQINGLFGIMQTLAFEKQAIGTKLYGPKGLTNFINILRHMDIGKQKTYNFSSFDFGGDHLLGTNVIPLDYLQPIQINEQNCNDSRQFIKNGIFKDQYLEIIPIHTQSSIQYIIKTQPQKGQILKEKLDEFNIPQNLMKELVQKGYIEIKGKIIEIQNVSSQDSPSQVLMILDIQTQQELQEFLQQTKQLQDIYLTIHLSKQSIEPFYKQIIDTFKCRHIFAYYNQNDDFQYVSEYIQNKLHNSYPQNFPQYKNQFYFQYPNIECYQPLLEYTILPIRRQKDALNLLKDQLADIKEKVFPAPQDIIQQEFNDDKRLSFLGTGSMIPGKIRNVMSILIETQNYAIFLDCGEGTYKQVIDHGSNLNKEIIIWISHSHSDHHLGLMELLYQLKDRLVYLILPAIMVPWLNYYQSSIEKFNIKIIVAQSFEGNIEMQDLISEQYKNQEIATGPQIVLSQDQDFQQNFQDFLHKFHTEFQLNITQVEHCPQAYGIKITFADNRAVSYSGDTRPCENFCKLAQNSSIMIHEATFTDDLEENAKKNMHCTISDAINIGRQSNSKAIVLTHFSQRLAKGLQQTEQYQDKNIVFTCDHFSGYFSEYETLGPMSIQISKILTDD